MSEFAHEMTERVAQAASSLEEAAQAGDDYLVDVRLGELESLARVAHEHGLEVPTATQALARHGHVEQIELPQDEAAAAPLHVDLTGDRSAAAQL